MTFNVVVHSILLLAHLTATLVGAHKVPLLISNIFDCHFKSFLTPKNQPHVISIFSQNSKVDCLFISWEEADIHLFAVHSLYTKRINIKANTIS